MCKNSLRAFPNATPRAERAESVTTQRGKGKVGGGRGDGKEETAYRWQGSGEEWGWGRERVRKGQGRRVTGKKKTKEEIGR